MSLIHVLDEPTINQIAAGEVVERPCAVVKELIENAMDAGATAITAEIKEGGLSFIRITDNGAGIAREDIPLAFLRHATSKIKTAEDLLSVTSLGFRGEALSSIAAVAQVELITKIPSSLNGYRYLIEGGEEKSMEEIGCPGGTTIIIRNLFFNTPARRKFLKSAITEAGYISDLMERLMISHPNVSFKFIMNNQVKLQSSGNNNSRDILYQVYGRDITKELLPLNFTSQEMKISGFIGKPIINRGNRNYENYFINGRYIKSNIITKAIEEAYKPFLMQHKYPFTSIYFEIDPSGIDVNVHPQKMEIRLKNSEAVYQQIYEAIRNVLLGKEMIPKVILTKQDNTKEIQPPMPEPFEENRRKQLLQQETAKKSYIPPIEIQSFDKSNALQSNTFRYGTGNLSKVTTDSILAEKTFTRPDSLQEAISEPVSAAEPIIKIQPPDVPVQAHTHEEKKTDQSHTKQFPDAVTTTVEQMSLFSDSHSEANVPFLSEQALNSHRIIGQLFSTYWLVEYKKELYIIDQHAAHEKVLYERILATAKEKKPTSQQLLPPIVLSLTLREQDILHKREDILNRLGYEFEHFGGNEYSVRAVPLDLYGISEKELLLEFIDDMAQDFNTGSPSANSILERIASLSCKAAVKANHSFSTQEAASLIKELFTLQNPYHCPHGRPVIISMSQYELERKFKRIL